MHLYLKQKVQRQFRSIVTIVIYISIFLSITLRRIYITVYLCYYKSKIYLFIIVIFFNVNLLNGYDKKYIQTAISKTLLVNEQYEQMYNIQIQ